MGQSILQVKDAEGNWNSILALKGDNGLTPFIGENGNWFVGTLDTGVCAAPDLTEYYSLANLIPLTKNEILEICK